jgi:hypothetical protein
MVNSVGSYVRWRESPDFSHLSYNFDLVLGAQTRQEFNDLRVLAPVRLIVEGMVGQFSNLNDARDCERQ